MSHETFEAPELDQLAEMLPAYDFDSFIAKGGMGAVYKATQRSLDREVAIKILPRELGADPEFRKSFQTEAKAMAKLNHPNLIGVYDYGDIDGMPYIVMEYVGGKSLYHSAWNKVIEPDQAIAIVNGICEGLGHAHEHDILHRDIKPANILLTPKAKPKIGDFGLAQQTDSAGTGEVMGTPGYAAPELTQNPELAGIGTDIYAVGVILHELLSGQQPDPSGEEAPHPLDDPGLEAIWKKATNPDINKRYATASELAAALTAWRPTRRKLATRPAHAVSAPKKLATAAPAKTATPATPASSPAGSTASPKSVPPPVVAPASNWSLVRNALIFAVVAAVAGIGFKMYQSGKKANDAEESAANKEQFEKDKMAEAEQKNQNLANESNTPEPEQPTTAENDPKTTTPKDPEPQEIEETPAESLARLKDDLVAGKRDELPKGSKRRGTNDYLLINEPLAWYDAQTFAEQHGAQLAILGSNEELTWISNLVPDDQAIWLGSGRSERNVWTDNDGSDWDLDEEPKGVGSFATLSNLGILRAGKVTDAKPFIIQWHRDGSNPGTIQTILERTSKTLDTPNPIYPPGTISLGTRRILFLPASILREDADALAKSAAGILAVPSTQEEISWIRDESESLEATAGFWIGGQRKDGTWTWDTGETWDKSAWIDDAEPTDGGDAMIFIPGKGWSNAAPDQPVAGLLIEWSTDASTE
ncbi:protein kinase domain-containing protein [Haloferula sp.]|uniref:protein kinase domain-containing protein n=1 Tax=Haloferula sp. TaxID=2497595 RepID=UPI0032A06F9F